MHRRRLLPLLCVAVLAGCSFVKPTEEGKKVRLLAPHEVERCRSLGTLTSQVQDRIGAIHRTPEAVQEDVLVNAKNAAADLGGDTIVATSELKDGKQTFGVYRCLTP